MATVIIDNDYTLAQGEELDFFDETGLLIAGPGGPYVIIAGTVSLKVDGSVDGVSAIAFDYTTNHATVWNEESGLIRVIGKSADAFGVAGRFYDDATFTNDGRVIVAGNNDGEGFDFQDQEGSCINRGLISVTATDHDAIGLFGVASVTNAGIIRVSGDTATAFQLFNYSYLTNSGKIIAIGDSFTTGVDITGNFNNEGVIRVIGGDHASVGVAFHQQPGFNVFQNHGLIVVTGDERCVGVEIRQSDPNRNSYKNDGIIKAEIAFSAAPVAHIAMVALVNSGKIIGQIELTNQSDEVYNIGKIAGEVLLLGGDDVYMTIRNGKLNGTINGGSGDDVLLGGKSDDRLNGDGAKAASTDGDDKITGARGGDTLTGGHGRDVFAYLTLSDSEVGHGDLITDLEARDVIDLSGIDADGMQEGDQAFLLVSGLDGHAGQAAFVYDAAQDLTRLMLDVDGDGEADAAILISGDHHDFTRLAL